MSQGSAVLAMPGQVTSVVQDGLLERAFHDGLYPALQYRSEAMFERWDGNTGTEIFMTRPGLLKPNTTPLRPGVDPTPQAVTWEQWVARLDQYGDTIDTHIPTSKFAASDLLMRNIHQLGLQAGQSINRIPRNALFRAYLSGQTATIAAALSTDTTIRVASVNGFTDVIVVTTTARPVPVGPATPLPVSIGGVGNRNVIGVLLDNPSDVYGPGTLVLSAAIGGAGIAARASVVSAYAPKVIRTGGGLTVDALSLSDTVVLQDTINASNELRRRNVGPHPDGFYHAHISTFGNSQIFSDAVFQRLNQSLPEHVIYKEGFIGTMAGIMYFMNTESPDTTNSGSLTATGTNAMYASDIGAEVTNEGGVQVGRILITGKGALYELGFDESDYVTEAGINGKIGEFDVVNNGLSILLERVRLILRAPVDRMQQIVSATWSITNSFPVPSDITATSGPERYKRAIIIEHAIG